jgi:hypothetical protein
MQVLRDSKDLTQGRFDARYKIQDAELRKGIGVNFAPPWGTEQSLSRASRGCASRGFTTVTTLQHLL